METGTATTTRAAETRAPSRNLALMKPVPQIRTSTFLPIQANGGRSRPGARSGEYGPSGAIGDVVRASTVRWTVNARPAFTEPVQQVLPHRDGGRDLPGGLRVVVEGQAQRRLREHLGGLGVARVAAAHLGVGAAAAALADEAHRELRPGAPFLARALALRQSAQQDRRTGGTWAAAARPPTTTDPADDRGELLHGGVVAVGEVRAVALQGGRRASYDERVDRRQRHQPEAGVPVEVRPLRGGAHLATLEPGLDLAPLGVRPASSAGRGRTRSSAEAKVPPESVALLRTMPRIRSGTPGGSCWTVNIAPRSCGMESKPQACTIRAPVSTARGVVREVRPVDELRLPGQVDVVGARPRRTRRRAARRARRTGPTVVITTRARLGDVGQRRGVGDVGVQQRQRRERRVVRREAVAHGLELRLVAAGQRPAAAVGRGAGQVVGGEPAGEAGGAEQDDVELARRGTGALLGSGVRPHSAREPGRAPTCVPPSRAAQRRPRRSGTTMDIRRRGITTFAVGRDGRRGRLRRAHHRRARLGRAPGRRGRVAVPAPRAAAGELPAVRRLRAAAAVVRRPGTARRSARTGSAADRSSRWDWPSAPTRPPARRPADKGLVGDTGGAVGSSGTGTNTQEADVDESDVAKTDGSLVVRVSGRELVVTDVTGEHAPRAVPHDAARPRPERRPSCCSATTGSSWWATRSAVSYPVRRPDRPEDRSCPPGRPTRAPTSSPSTSPTRRRRG